MLVLMPRAVLALCLRPVLVVVDRLHLLWTLDDKVSLLAASKACL
jgi:hypothetical protein